MKNVVLIAGVHGVSGRAAAESWASVPGTPVYGLSRRSAPLPAGVEAILADLLDAVEPASASLRHVTFYQGGKAYGADLGPFKTPAREEDMFKSLFASLRKDRVIP